MCATLLGCALALLSGCVIHIEAGPEPYDALPVYACHELSPIAEHREFETGLFYLGGAPVSAGQTNGAAKQRR